MRLTDLLIKKLKAPDKGQKTYFDDALSGFGIRISQGGTKSYVVMYGNRRQLKTFGRYPELSLADARIEAKRLQSDRTLLQGNLSGHIQNLSFNDARDQFLKNAETRTKPSTFNEYKRILNQHFSFSKKLNEITRKDITLSIEKNCNSESVAQHAFVAIRTMMNWCLKQGLISSSPMPSMTFKSEPRSRILTDEELKRVWERACVVGYPYGDIVKILTVTGQRRGEISQLRWSWIEDDEIIFPKGFTKNKREHRIPLSNLAKQILEDVSGQGDLIFPARGKTDVAVSGWSKYKRSFDNPKDGSEFLVEDYTLHDLRRTFSSNLARLGTPIHVTEKLLNHVSGTLSGVAAVYNRYSYMSEMSEAVAAHDEFIRDVTAE
ncbi:MAG: tyrosine-type recombinase/integrase [Flavobacteriaceae bacterium]|nr:tyrosine-type recombinase/integrase [Flavobacteriaceae bacterium]